MTSSQKIKPFLWFNTEAEQAANYYIAAFKDSKITNVQRQSSGAVMVVEFNLSGQDYVALNGGPHFKLNEAFSLMVTAEDQAEVDHLWAYFIADGGAPSRCGWLKDKFGLSWQIVPQRFFELMKGPDKAGSSRVFQAMMGMTKFDIAALEKAYSAA